MVEKIDLYKNARLTLIEIRYLWSIGNSYTQAVSSLQDTSSNNFVSIELLSSQALEILLKSYLGSEVCIKNKEKDSKHLKLIIDKMFRGFGHNLEKLLDKDVFFKKGLEITSIEKINNGFVSDYRIKLENESILSFKELESVRYGSFAKNPNIMNGIFPKENLEFLKKLSEIIYDKITSNIKSLKN